MNLIHALNYLTILIIIFAIYGISVFLSTARYSLIKAVGRFIFKGDNYYIKWFYENSIYFWCKLLLILLVCTDLSLITQFSKNSIFQKPLFIFAVSPALWLVLIVVGFFSLRAYIKLYKL